ncbi:MAG: hypothetical protein JWN04_1455 [Myxococcaceae bacterium]|nr:hypothetical protein [Myxococcaceae bacterium]
MHRMACAAQLMPRVVIGATLPHRKATTDEPPCGWTRFWARRDAQMQLDSRGSSQDSEGRTIVNRRGESCRSEGCWRKLVVARSHSCP